MGPLLPPLLEPFLLQLLRRLALLLLQLQVPGPVLPLLRLVPPSLPFFGFFGPAPC